MNIVVSCNCYHVVVGRWSCVTCPGPEQRRHVFNNEGSWIRRLWDLIDLEDNSFKSTTRDHRVSGPVVFWARLDLYGSPFFYVTSCCLCCEKSSPPLEPDFSLSTPQAAAAAHLSVHCRGKMQVQLQEERPSQARI